MIRTVNLTQMFGQFRDYWKPKIVGDINDTHVKLVKLKGEFVWHHHEREDELFLVVKGRLVLKLRDRDLVHQCGVDAQSALNVLERADAFRRPDRLDRLVEVAECDLHAGPAHDFVPRKILKRALLANAAGVILYHNHPSGDPSPSREDREFTRRLAAAAESVGLRLLDHIIVGREGCVSFREAGLM